MRVYSKKTYMFKNGDEIEFIRNEEIKDVKDWVADDPLFKLAKADGSIEEIETIAQQRNVEKGNSRKVGKDNTNKKTEESEQESNESSTDGK